jgi:hypothetical protein
MNTQLIDTLVQIINTLSPAEREILEQKLHPEPISIPSDDWAKEPFIGMWKDREDMNDSSFWVRQVRQREWDR